MRRLAVVALAVVALVAPNGAAAAAEAVVAGNAPATRSTSTAGANPTLNSSPVGSRVSFSGGDLVSLARPRTIQSSRLSKRWKAVTVAGIPAAAAQSVVLAIGVNKATRDGQVLVRPAGGTATSVAPYQRKITGSSTVLVRLGPGGRVEVSATAGAPLVMVQVVAWVPRTAAIVTPSTPVKAVKAKLTKATRTVTVAGTGGVPSSATALWVEVGTTTKQPGRLALWAAGSVAPRTGVSLARGTTAWSMMVAPGTAGRLSLRMLGGTANVSVRVVGWSLPGAVLGAPATARSFGSVKGRSDVRVGGRAGVPAATRAAVLQLTGAIGTAVTVAGQRVRLGPAPTTVLAAVVKGSITVRVTGKRARVQVAVTGWSDDAAQQWVSYLPKAGTKLVGPSDVVQQAGTGVVLDASADAVRVGDALLIRPRSGAAPYLSRVTSVRTLPGGRRDVRLASGVTLSDAFADYQASYHGAVSTPATSSAAHLAAAVSRANPRVTAGLSGPAGLGLAMFGGKNWGCTSAVGAITSPVAMTATWDGDVGFEVSLAQKKLDLSLRGALIVSVTLQSSTTITCTLSGDLPAQFPLGATGMAVTLGGSASLSFAPEQEGTAAGITFTATGRVYSSVWSYSGRSGSTSTTGRFGSVTPSGRSNLSLELGLTVGIKMLKVIADVSPVKPEAGLTVGLSLKVAPAGPEGRSGVYRGPRCIDVTLGAFIDVGASLATDFFPAISVSVARYDSPTTTLYRGPCYGYEGMIAVTEKGIYDSGRIDFDHSLVRTLTSQAAVFQEGSNLVLFQESTWSAFHEVKNSPYVGDPLAAYPKCLYHAGPFSASGADVWGGKHGDPWVMALYDNGTIQASSFVQETPVTTTQNVTGCPPGSNGKSPYQFEASMATSPADIASYTFPAGTPPTIAASWSGSIGERELDFQVNLVRKEFTR